jgi:ABC-type transport system involved in multi-copper enzyme maturation permease subunit
MYVVHLTMPGERAEASRWAVTLLTVVWLGGVMLLAAGAISRERERRTLESLLSTPLDIEEILAAKAIGCLYGTAWVGVLLAGVLVLGLFTGGLALSSAWLLLLGWTIWTAFFISLGLWFSCRSTSSTRSVFLTVISGALLMVSPPLLARPLSRLALHLDWSMGQVLLLEDALFFGLSPAAASAELAMLGNGSRWVMGGWILLMSAAVLLTLDTLRRLRQETEQ